MRLTVLGCAGSFPGPQSPASSYLVQAEDGAGRTWNILLDLGSGALGALQNVIDPRDVDAVGLSHLHPDHVADMSGLYVYRKYHPDYANGAAQSPTPLPVYGPQATVQRLAEAYGLDPEETMDGVFDVRTWRTGQAIGIGPVTLSVYPVRHPIEAYAIRLTGPSDIHAGQTVTITYSGDTDLCDGLVEAAFEADAFLCEAAFVEGRDDHLDGIHLTGKRAGIAAQQAGARSLLLTHIPAWNDAEAAVAEARDEYTGPCQGVNAGQIFTL